MRGGDSEVSEDIGTRLNKFRRVGLAVYTHDSGQGIRNDLGTKDKQRQTFDPAACHDELKFQYLKILKRIQSYMISAIQFLHGLRIDSAFSQTPTK
jgi:hypothetical protein